MNTYSLTYSVEKKGFKPMQLNGVVVAENQAAAVALANQNFKEIQDKEEAFYSFKLKNAKKLKHDFFFIQSVNSEK